MYTYNCIFFNSHFIDDLRGVVAYTPVFIVSLSQRSRFDPRPGHNTENSKLRLKKLNRIFIQL